MSEGNKPDFSLSYDLGGGVQIGADCWPGRKDALGTITVWIKQYSEKHDKYFPKGSIMPSELSQLASLQAHMYQLAFSEREIGDKANPPAKPQKIAPKVDFDGDDIPY